MLRNCKEEDFYELKCVAEDRMRPDAIPAFLLAAAIVSLIPTIIVVATAKGSNIILWDCIAVINIFFSSVQLVNAVFFISIKRCFRFQKYAATATCMSALIISIDFYQIFFYMARFEVKDKFLIIAGLLLMIGGFIFLIASTIRAIKRVEDGALRKGGKLLFDFQQRKGKVNAPLIYALTILSGVLARTFANKSENDMLSAILFMSLSAFIQYAMALALPEFFLMVYCKFRFDNFIVEMPQGLREELNKPKKKRDFKDLKKALKVTAIVTLIVGALTFDNETDREISMFLKFLKEMFYFYIYISFMVYILIKIKNWIIKLLSKLKKGKKTQKRRHKK